MVSFVATGVGSKVTTFSSKKLLRMCLFLYLYSQNPCTKSCTAWTLVQDFKPKRPRSTSLLYVGSTIHCHYLPFPSCGTTNQTPHLVTKTQSQEALPARTLSLLDNIRQWMVLDANAAEEDSLGGSILTLEEAVAPTKEEIQLLEDAIQALYEEQNFIKAESLLTKAIAIWVRQPVLEQAELYQLRGDCYMYLRRPAEALKDYTVVVKFLENPEVDETTPPDDKQRLYLAMARALRSRGVLSSQPTIASKQQAEAAKYYELSFSYSSSNDESDEDYEERQLMGLMKNPFAAWEYADALRGSGDLNKAAILHQFSSDAFDNIGDKARALISDLDAVIDLAAANKVSLAQKILMELLSLKQVEARDVKVLQRVIAKKGEAQAAVAAALWDSNDKSTAEVQYGEACLRLEQLDVQDSRQQQQKANEGTSVRQRNSSGGSSSPKDVVSLGFSIDDLPGAGEISCAKFKNEKFLSETLRWPPSLTEKLSKLEKLKQ